MPKKTATVLHQASGRKRQYSETSEPASFAFPDDIQRLRLEAIFHPKFENESSDQQVRKQMVDRVAASDGYLEVSVKHSGSLMLWSGGQRYYSKNSADNQFTLVGEILLRQHFGRASGRDDEKESLYKACSDFVEANSLTLAFEVVTSVLGDHGQRPKRDFLILTAVADKATERFYSTTEIIAFAQRFQLPANDCWVFSNEASVHRLFDTYDTLRETALASSVIARLSSASQYHIMSMYPHSAFQGEIIEGVVVRFVPYEQQTRQSMLEAIEKLSLRSAEISSSIPPDTPDCFELAEMKDSNSFLYRTNIRELFQQTNSSPKDPRSEFTSLLRAGARDGMRMKLERLPKSKDVDIVGLARRLTNAEDAETSRIAKLITTLSDLNIKANYVVNRETKGSVVRWLCTIHIFHDVSFRKYHHNLQEGDMNLFRGFSVELSSDNENESNLVERRVLPSFEARLDRDISHGDFLMLKLKFLPYMVRTFVCRNHLRTLSKGGTTAFLDAAENLLKRWSISLEGRERWLPFFAAWAEYAKDQLPRLTESCYLEHLERFTGLYEAGKLQPKRISSTSALRGLVVVVSPKIEIAKKFSSLLAGELGGARSISGLDEISTADMIDICEPGKGVVCPIRPRQGKGLQKLTNTFSDNIAIVFCECGDSDLQKMPDEERKALQGMLKGIRSKNRNARQIQLPSIGLVSKGGTVDFEKNEVLAALKQKLLSMSHSEGVDMRQGMLLFFPGIPGCGKSTLANKRFVDDVQSEVKHSLPDFDRDVRLYIGDETKGKFWPKIRKERATRRSSVFVIDKNVPASSWSFIADICASTKAVAVPVIPESSALKTTEVFGFRKPDGTNVAGVKHCYPFSLHYFALCMSRVLARKPGSHPGGLDSSLPRCCMVVAMFMGLYRRLSAESFLETMKNDFVENGATFSSEPISLPFVTSTADLPADLKSVLEESLQAQFGYERERVDTTKNKDKYLNDLESRLRKCLVKHAGFFKGSSENQEISRKRLKDQVIRQFSLLDKAVAPPTRSRPTIGNIKLASVDVSMNEVHSLLLSPSLKKKIPQFVAQVGGNSVIAGQKTTSDDFIRSTHVTLLHITQSSQKELKDNFGPLNGEAVDLAVTGMIWNQDIAALSVSLPGTTRDGTRSLPSSQNDFVHITIWCKPGVTPMSANELPRLASKGSATRVTLESPVTLSGTVSLWSDKKSSKGGVVPA